MLVWWFCVYRKDGPQLASSRASSATADVVDVTTVMEAFQGINHCRLVVKLTTVAEGHRADLLITMDAVSIPEMGRVPVSLGSVSVKCSALGLKTLDSAVLAALYRMDFKLAEAEFERTKNPEA